MSWLEHLRSVVDPSRVVDSRHSLQLTESNPASTCAPVVVRGQLPHFAIRLPENCFLPILVGERQGGGFRKNPVYLIFSERPLGHPKDPALNVMVCELKSGETGAESAHRQVQLGILMARYLISIAAYARGQSRPPVIACCGLIASPAPTNLAPKGRTKPGRSSYHSEPDPIFGVEFYRIPCGEELHLESFEYYSL